MHFHRPRAWDRFHNRKRIDADHFEWVIGHLFNLGLTPDTRYRYNRCK